MKLLQVPAVELESRVKEELESNPALDEGSAMGITDEEIGNVPPEKETPSAEEEIDIRDYLRDDDYRMGYKKGGNIDYGEKKEMPIASQPSLHESLIAQLGFLDLSEQEYVIGKQLIGSIEDDGYIRRDLEAIVNDLAFSKGLSIDIRSVEEVLKKIQSFDPAGIAARDLRECLLIQLNRLDIDRKKDVAMAKQLLTQCHEAFFKKHYDKIVKKLNLEHESEIKGAVELITRLNPKPGGADPGITKNPYIIPDFILSNRNGKLDLALNSKNAPELKISRSYSNMLDTYDKSKKKDKKLKEVVLFVKQKLDAAKWFIDAIRQRQHTLLKIMQAILDFQFQHFFSGDESKLKPMILKDIAQLIGMDISTVSRVVSSKTIQTDFGVFPLRHFFSEGIITSTGEEVSNREVKQAMLALIAEEEKQTPLSDDKLERMLKEKGYPIARRTVAKYREQLNIPVARLRRKLL